METLPVLRRCKGTKLTDPTCSDILCFKPDKSGQRVYKLPSSLYKREIFDRVEGLAKQFPAVVVTGARQVGKTTLLRATFPTHSYVTLDVPADAGLAESDPAAFLRRYPPPILIDEVQYAPQLFRQLSWWCSGRSENLLPASF